VVECAECGFKNAPGVVFCGKCGKSLPVSVVREKKSIADNMTQIIITLIVVVAMVVILWLVLSFIGKNI